VTELEKFLASLRRVLFQGEFGTEKGWSILQRRARVLGLDPKQMEDMVRKQLDKYGEYVGLLEDLSYGEVELTEFDLEEIDAFQDDLELTSEEAELLKDWYQQGREIPALEGGEEAQPEAPAAVDEAQEDVEDEEPQQEQAQPEEYSPYTKTPIPGTSYVLETRRNNPGEVFYYRYSTVLRLCYNKFVQSVSNLDSASDFNRKKLYRITMECVEPLIDEAHHFMVRVFEIMTVSRDSLYEFLELDTIAEIGARCEAVAAEIEAAIREDKMLRKGSGSSTTIGVGSLGFMAAVAAFQGIKGVSRSVSNARANEQYARHLNQQALSIFRDQASKLLDAFASGAIRLFDVIATTKSLPTFEEISRLEDRSEAIVENAAAFKADQEKYIEHMVSALSYNPFNMEAYLELQSCFTGEAQLVILNQARRHALFKKDEDKLDDMIAKAQYALEAAAAVPPEFGQLRELMLQWMEGVSAQFAPHHFSLKTGDELAGYADQFAQSTGLALNRESILGQWITERTTWFLGTAGAYVIEGDSYYTIPYLDLISLDYNARRRELLVRMGHGQVTLGLGKQCGSVPSVIKFLNGAKNLWADLEGQADELTLFNQAREAGLEQLHDLASRILEGAEFTRIRFAYTSPEHYYTEKWQQANEEGYPEPEVLAGLAQLQQKLGLEQEAVKKIEQELRTQYYRERVKEAAQMQLSYQELTERLQELRDEFTPPLSVVVESELESFRVLITVPLDQVGKQQRPLLEKHYLEHLGEADKEDPDLAAHLQDLRDAFGIHPYQAMKREEEVLGEAYSVDPQSYAVAEFALQKYGELGKKPFGSKFYNLLEDQVEEKLANALRAYGPELEEGELLLFLLDDTVFGSAKEGFVISDRRIFGSKAQPTELKDIIRVIEQSHDFRLDKLDGSTSIPAATLRNEPLFVDFLHEVIEFAKGEQAGAAHPVGDDQAPAVEEALQEQNEPAGADVEIYIAREVRRLEEAVQKLNDRNVAVLGSIPKDRLATLLANFNFRHRESKVKEEHVLAFYDDTVFGSGKKGFLMTPTGFAVYMGKNQGFVRFADLVEPPQYNEGVVNSGIILKTADKVVDLYCTGLKGPQLLCELASLLHHFRDVIQDNNDYLFQLLG
jgi:chemotaxis protein histidine kinase CheA